MKGKPRLRVLPYIPPAERPKVEAPALGGICDYCLKKNSVGPVDGTGILSVYCTHNECGAAVLLKAGAAVGKWLMRCPVTMQEWASTVADTAIVIQALMDRASAGGDPPVSHTETEH